MDAIINSIVTPVVESLMVPVKKHLGFLVSSTKHVTAMKEEMDQLNITEQDIQEKKTTADANYHVVPRLVSPWLEDVQKMKEKVESIPTAGIECFNVAKRYKAGKQSCIILQQIKALKERASVISWTNERKSIFRVRVLNEAEAKTLFFEIVGPTLSDGGDDELQKIGEDIVNKCGGLPTALKTIAKSLIGNIKEAWKETLSNLQHDDLQDLNDILHKIFEMSYNNLKKDDDAKSIFLLSGLFPDDFDIPIEDLMRYGWGLKLFSKVHASREARRRTIICVNNLIWANLLTESDRMGCVKMHDLVRVFAFSNFSKVKQASIVYHDNMSGHQLINDTKESYERVLLNCIGISKFPVGFNYPNLSLLIVMNGGKLLKFPQDIYENSEKLEVVCYEKIGIPLLPVVFEHSTKLRTLCLRSCSLIDDISFLGSLSNLEALSLVDCVIRRLPWKIGMLKKLKILDLTGCVDLLIDDGVFQN